MALVYGVLNWQPIFDLYYYLLHGMASTKGRFSEILSSSCFPAKKQKILVDQLGHPIIRGLAFWRETV